MNFSSDNPLLDAAHDMGEAALKALQQRDEAREECKRLNITIGDHADTIRHIGSERDDALEALTAQLEIAQTWAAVAAEHVAENERLLARVAELEAHGRHG